MTDPDLGSTVEDLVKKMFEVQEGLARMQVEKYDKRSNDPKPARDEDQNLKFDVGEFTGTNDVDAYIEWEDALERYFEYKETSEARKVKIAVAKLSKYASIWYNGIKKAREREGKKIEDWGKLRKLLRRRFVPTGHKQGFFIKLASLKQDNSPVDEYITEFESLTLRCEMEEGREKKIARFIAGVHPDIRERIELQPNLTFEEVCNSAVIFDKQRRKSAAKGAGKKASCKNE